MPIYEYACRKCKHTLDALQKLSDVPLVECPECAEPELRRLISAPRFRLKGEGWYETDFKKDKQRNLLSSDEPPKEKAADKAAKTDAGGKDSGKTTETPKPAKETKKETKAPAD